MRVIPGPRAEYWAAIPGAFARLEINLSYRRKAAAAKVLADAQSEILDTQYYFSEIRMVPNT